MSGRHEQLARQIRRLRTHASEPARTLQRAVHLALDLANEHTDGDFAALAAKGVIDPLLAARLDLLSAAERLEEKDVVPQTIIDLDVFLRSVEQGSPAQPLPIEPLDSAPKLPPGAHRASVNVSGRIVSVIGRDGRAMVVVDDRPIGMIVAGERVPHFALVKVPMSTHELSRTPDGAVHIVWNRQLRLIVAPDFESVTVEIL